MIQSIHISPTNLIHLFKYSILLMEPPTKRRKYDASIRLKVIEVAKASNTARTFDVTEKMMRDWRKNEDNLRNMPEEKCAMRKGSTHDDVYGIF